MPTTYDRQGNTELDQTLAVLKNTLRYMAQSGISGFECRSESLEALQRWGKAAPPPDTLDGIRRALGDCRRCGLSQHRRKIVFGEGASRARLVFVGEGPGFDEDREGRPFVGAAGRLLTNIITAMHLKREDVYICNVVKCHPPGNRNPNPDEIRCCLPFLEQQLALIQPDYICTLGTIATQTLLKTGRPISKLRGRFHPYGRCRLMPTFHPAYLLRNPARKREVWDDMKQLMQAMGLS